MKRYPSPTYLLGSLIEDEVPPDVANRITTAYVVARSELTDEKTNLWLRAMLNKLGTPRDYPSTALAVLAYPSGHQAAHYDRLAREAGWKEADHAHDPEQV